MRVAEGAEEGVEVVGGGGEVEERGVLEFGVEGCVELWHAGDGEGVFDAEGVVQDAEGGGGLGDFDGVVDVAYDCPAGWFGEVGGAFEAERGWEVGCCCLDGGAGRSAVR